MRTINMTVTGDLVAVDATVVGVQGSGNADTIRLTLDGAWDGYAKTATWWDGHGEEAASRTLTADLLEDMAVSTRCYLLPVPGEALRYGGTCTLVLDGYADGVRSRTMTQEFSVARAPMRRVVADNEGVTTPTEMEQMQEQVDTLLGQLQTVTTGEAARVKAEDKRQSAEAERVEAEETRKSNEAVRLLDELDRSSAEAERSRAEIARGSAEDDRVGREQIREENESDRKAAETMRRNAEVAREAAEEARQGAVGAQVEAATRAANQAVSAAATVVAGAASAEADANRASAAATQATQCAGEAKVSAEKAETVQAAVGLNRRVVVGPASMINEIGPGEVLWITDGGNAVVLAVTLHQLLNMTEEELTQTLTVTVAKTLNLRRNAEGAFFDADTLAELAEKLTALKAAAIEGGYVDEVTGAVALTWAQVQFWILTQTLKPALAAEAEGIQWSYGIGHRMAAMTDRMDALESSLEYLSDQINQQVEGADGP